MIPNPFRELVERVVGPVWAGESRKDRMREELLAHLEASFEEERGHLGDDGAAGERAIRRLGEPGALTRSLQDSVPWLERILYTRLIPPSRREVWWRRRHDEALLKHAIRVTIGMTALGVFGDLMGLLMAATFGAHRLDWRVILVWGPATLLVCAAGCFLSPFLCEGMIRALQDGPSRWYRSAMVAALSSLMVIALVLTFVVIVTIGAPHGQVFQRSDWLRVLAIALLAPIVLVVAAMDTISWRSRRDGWDCSEIVGQAFPPDSPRTSGGKA
jgi:hypothetical protein